MVIFANTASGFPWIQLFLSKCLHLVQVNDNWLHWVTHKMCACHVLFCFVFTHCIKQEYFFHRARQRMRGFFSLKQSLNEMKDDEGIIHTQSCKFDFLNFNRRAYNLWFDFVFVFHI